MPQAPATSQLQPARSKEFDMFEQITKFANEATTSITDSVNDAMNDNNITERFTTTSDRVLDAVLDTNRRIVDAAVTTADRVAEQFRSQVTVELPFADRLPTPTVAGERYLDFVERAVSLNRDMNQRVVDMITADNAKKAPAARKAVAKKIAAKKTVAKKTVAKKAVARKSPAKKTVAEKAVTVN